MEKGQKRGEGWKIAKDGSVNIQFKLNINNKEDRELLDMLQGWRQAGKMKATMRKAIGLIIAVEQGYKEVIESTLLEHMNAKIDLLLSRPLPPPVDSVVQTGKSISAPNFSAPDFEDDDIPNLSVRADSNAAGKVTNNFLDAALGMQVVQTPQ